MACCKVQGQSWLTRVASRQYHLWRGVACSRLFSVSPWLAGVVYRRFGLWLGAIALGVPALVWFVALTPS